MTGAAEEQGKEDRQGSCQGARPLGCTLRLRPRSDPECRPWQTTLIKSGSDGGRSLPPPIRSDVAATAAVIVRPCHNLKHPVLPLALLVVVAVVDIVRVRVRLSPFLCLRLGGHWYWFGPSAKQLTSSSE